MRDNAWECREGSGGLSWAERSRMGLLRGVIDAADIVGRRNGYLHELHTYALDRFLRSRHRLFHRSLDFGCGTGRFIPLLSRYSQEVHGADRSPSMVEAARRHNPQFAENIAACPNGPTPFPNGHFDLALSFSVLSVMPREQLDSALQEIRRICMPSALLLLCERLSDRDGLTLDFYQEKLAGAGFSITEGYPIRSARSHFPRIAAHPAWPARLNKYLAAAEVNLARELHPKQGAAPYFEYLFACTWK